LTTSVCFHAAVFLVLLRACRTAGGKCMHLTRLLSWLRSLCPAAWKNEGSGDGRGTWGYHAYPYLLATRTAGKTTEESTWHNKKRIIFSY